LPLFGYGTLRRGEENHHVLAGRYERALPATLPDWKRGMAGHGYPTVRAEPGASVRGELFFLQQARYEETLRRCDTLEDLEPGTTMGRYYRRAAVTVETAEGAFVAWAYLGVEGS
jgi:gamma-glutamylcyclotransferase (GGCT)/AIG2-like uncharacterized protein YtfP